MKKVRVLAGIAALTPAALVLAPHVAQAKTREANCSAAPHHWTIFGGARTFYTCFGYNGGTWQGHLKSVSSICGGNNYGFYSGYASNGNIGAQYEIVHAGFREGTTFAALPYTQLTGTPDSISAMHISDWAKSDTCQLP
jgi:hypothetical protein